MAPRRLTSIGTSCPSTFCAGSSWFIFLTLSSGDLGTKLVEGFAVCASVGASLCLALSDAVYVCDVCFLDRTSKCDRAILVFVLLVSLWVDCATRSFSALSADRK